jgi:hypothetical protein
MIEANFKAIFNDKWLTDHIDVGYVNISHLVSRLDGVDIVYKLSQIFLAIEFKELKEKHEFLNTVVGCATNFLDSELVVKPEELSDSTTVVFYDFREQF